MDDTGLISHTLNASHFKYRFQFYDRFVGFETQHDRIESWDLWKLFEEFTGKLRRFSNQFKSFHILSLKNLENDVNVEAIGFESRVRVIEDTKRLHKLTKVPWFQKYRVTSLQVIPRLMTTAHSCPVEVMANLILFEYCTVPLLSFTIAIETSLSNVIF